MWWVQAVPQRAKKIMLLTSKKWFECVENDISYERYENIWGIIETGKIVSKGRRIFYEFAENP